MLDTYLLMHQLADRQVGRVLDALAARPKIAANTIVVFPADHGDLRVPRQLLDKHSVGG